MIKKELISEVHKDLKNAGLASNISESQLIFDTVMNVLSDNISKGKDINISNFGNFYSKPVRRVNPRDPSKAFRKFTVYFTASKTIKNKLNGV